MQQTFQRQFLDSPLMGEEIRISVRAEAELYFNKKVILISEHSSKSDDGMVLYTAVYSPAPPQQGQ